MSNTLRDLVATSYQFGKSGLGVLTTEQAYSRALGKWGSLVTIHSQRDNVFFFSDDHIFGYKVLPSSFVACTGTFPTTAVARECIPDGKIDTIEKYIEVYHKGERQIKTIEELVEFIDNEKWVNEHATRYSDIENGIRN